MEEKVSKVLLGCIDPRPYAMATMGTLTIVVFEFLTNLSQSNG